MPLVNKKASVAKLVDATDSKSVSSDRVLVQVRPEVPNLTTTILKVVFLFPVVFCGIIWYDIKRLKMEAKMCVETQLTN